MHGYLGILYNSSRKDGANRALILFEDRYDKTDIKTIIDNPIGER